MNLQGLESRLCAFAEERDRNHFHSPRNPALARTAWQLLQEEGLGGYETPEDILRVRLSFLSLGGVFRSFCHVAWDQRADDSGLFPFHEAEWVISEPLAAAKGHLPVGLEGDDRAEWDFA